MNKLLATLIAGFFATGAFAQQAPQGNASTSAYSPAQSQAAGEARKQARMSKHKTAKKHKHPKGPHAAGHKPRHPKHAVAAHAHKG